MMITKRNVGFLVTGLSATGFALAQTAISTDGIVESTSGGFKFPDGTVQTTAAPATATITEYRIVGFTTKVTDGTATTLDETGTAVNGIVAMNQLCASEFGPAARFAFSTEQLAPSISPSTISTSTWIRPTAVRIIYVPTFPSGTQWQAYDAATGADGQPNFDPFNAAVMMDCRGFGSEVGGITGLTRLRTGQIDRAVCNVARRVTCSAPVQVTNAAP